MFHSETVLEDFRKIVGDDSNVLRIVPNACGFTVVVKKHTTRFERPHDRYRGLPIYVEQFKPDPVLFFGSELWRTHCTLTAQSGVFKVESIRENGQYNTELTVDMGAVQQNVTITIKLPSKKTMRGAFKSAERAARRLARELKLSTRPRG